MLHVGFDIRSVYHAILMVDLKWAERWQLEWLYSYNLQPISSRSDKTKKQVVRNETIKSVVPQAEVSRVSPMSIEYLSNISIKS